MVEGYFRPGGVDTMKRCIGTDVVDRVIASVACGISKKGSRRSRFKGRAGVNVHGHHQFFSLEMKNSSLPSRRQRGRRPPEVDTCICPRPLREWAN